MLIQILQRDNGFLDRATNTIQIKEQLKKDRKSNLNDLLLTQFTPDIIRHRLPNLIQKSQLENGLMGRNFQMILTKQRLKRDKRTSLKDSESIQCTQDIIKLKTHPQI